MSKINYLYEDAFLVSYPKSGRTWLRMMLAKILKDTGVDISTTEMLACNHKTVNTFVEQYTKSKKIVFLVRDPGDVIVSEYRELVNSKYSRWNLKGATISQFVHQERAFRPGDPKNPYNAEKTFGINNTIDYINDWFKHLHYFQDYEIITYEEMLDDPSAVLKQVLSFLGYSYTEENIKDAIEYSSFSNMQMIEKKGKNNNELNLLKNYKGRYGKDTTRIRKGKKGSYLEELEDKDIAYIDDAKKYLLQLHPDLIKRGIKY